MHKSPLFVGVAASAGTFLAMGATTLVVSSVTLSVAKRVIKQRKLKSAVPCTACSGSGYLRCDICQGRAVVRSRAPVPLKALVSKAGQPPVPAVLAACPGCGTTLQQRCLNCLGEGRVCLPS